MAIPAVLTVAVTGGVVAAEITPATNGNGSSTSVYVGGVVTLILGIIGACVQIRVSARRNKADADPELTLTARVAVIETNQADMKDDIAEQKATMRRDRDELMTKIEDILSHVRPWQPPQDDTRKPG